MAENGNTSKVGRLIETYNLGDAGEELEVRWTRGQDRWSLRRLADWFNIRLLEDAMSEAGVQSTDDELATTYELLTGDEVDEASHVQVRRRLERAGVDVEMLVDEFVTYQAIRTY